MLKQTVLLVLLIAILASTAFGVSPPLSFAKLFEIKNSNKKAPQNYVVCCEPSIFSKKGSFVQVSSTPNNSTLQVTAGTYALAVNFVTGQQREDYSYNVNGKIENFSAFDFKINSSLTISYNVEGQKCVCFPKHKNWLPICIQADDGSIITKAKFGEYDSLKIETIGKDYGPTTSVWTFRESQMGADKCWVFSSSALVATASQHQMYYDMVQKVEPSAFIVPSQCPSIHTCINSRY